MVGRSDLRRVMAVVAVLVLMAACGGDGGGAGEGSDETDPTAGGQQAVAPSPIDGDYFSGSSVLRLDEGTWSFVSGQRLRWTGEVSVVDSELTLGGEASCPEPGTYVWTVQGETLTLELVEDGCPGRGQLLAKEWRPILPLGSIDAGTPQGTVVTLPDLMFAGYWGQLDVSGSTTAEIDVFIREGYQEGGWAFAPTVLVGTPGQRLELTVRNPVGEGIFRTTHNITLEEQGISVDVPPREEVSVDVTFPDSGAVTFYCRFHADEGQAGILTVG